MRKQDDATADMAALNIRDSSGVGNDGVDDGGTGAYSVAGSDSDDLSVGSDEVRLIPPPPMKTTIYRKKESDPSNLAKLGVNELTYYPSGNVFIAHPVGSPTTPALVAKAPVPADGKGYVRAIDLLFTISILLSPSSHYVLYLHLRIFCFRLKNATPCS